MSASTTSSITPAPAPAPARTTVRGNTAVPAAPDTTWTTTTGSATTAPAGCRRPPGRRRRRRSGGGSRAASPSTEPSRSRRRGWSAARPERRSGRPPRWWPAVARTPSMVTTSPLRGPSLGHQGVDPVGRRGTGVTVPVRDDAGRSEPVEVEAVDAAVPPDLVLLGRQGRRGEGLGRGGAALASQGAPGSPAAFSGVKVGRIVASRGSRPGRRASARYYRAAGEGPAGSHRR